MKFLALKYACYGRFCIYHMFIWVIKISVIFTNQPICWFTFMAFVLYMRVLIEYLLVLSCIWPSYMIIRVHPNALTMHNVEYASLGPHANLITQWEHWVIVHLHHLWLICQLLPTLWDLLWVHLHHRLHLRIWGQNLFQDLARNLFQPECHLLWVHLVVQLVQFFQRVGLVILVPNSLFRVLVLQLAAVVRKLTLQAKQKFQAIPHYPSFWSIFMKRYIFMQVLK